ncbi:MAG: alginate export family protein, partial [Candidatus Omnitrophica bacterium]|nr:alginate export family protein [Candidatus Omnitrophota bacterium]
AKWTPSATVLFAYFSGENDTWSPGTNKKYRGWDPMFENQTFGHIANAIFPQSNLQLVGIKGSIKPREDITLGAEFYNYWFVKRFPNGMTALFSDYGGYDNGDNYIMKADRDMGREIDMTLTYDYTEDVQFNLLTGVFIPGGAFADINGRTATEVLGSVKVTF